MPRTRKGEARRKFFKSQKEYKINKLKDMTIFSLQLFKLLLLIFISIRAVLAFLARNQNKFSFASFRILFLFSAFLVFIFPHFYIFIFMFVRLCTLCRWKSEAERQGMYVKVKYVTRCLNVYISYFWLGGEQLFGGKLSNNFEKFERIETNFI